MEFNLIPLGIVSGFIVADILTGIIKGVAAQHSLKSAIMRMGLWHKVGIWTLVVFTMYCQFCANVWAEVPAERGMIYEATAVYIIMMEFTSIMENLNEVCPELASYPFIKLFKGVRKSFKHLIVADVIFN